MGGDEDPTREWCKKRKVDYSKRVSKDTVLHRREVHLMKRGSRKSTTGEGQSTPTSEEERKAGIAY